MKWVAHSCYSGGCCWLYDVMLENFILLPLSELIFVVSGGCWAKNALYGTCVAVRKSTIRRHKS